MATVNINVTPEWAKVANDADTQVLITWGTAASVEIATTSGDRAPEVHGHILSPGDAVTRSVIGPGFIWMRTTANSFNSTTLAIVSK